MRNKSIFIIVLMIATMLVTFQLFEASVQAKKDEGNALTSNPREPVTSNSLKADNMVKNIGPTVQPYQCDSDTGLCYCDTYADCERMKKSDDCIGGSFDPETNTCKWAGHQISDSMPNTNSDSTRN